MKVFIYYLAPDFWYGEEEVTHEITINHPDVKKLSLDEFTEKFNNGEISDLGFITYTTEKL